MKIHTRTVYQFNPETDQYEKVEDEWYEYEGPVAEAKGGGTQTTSNEPPAWALPHLTAIGNMAGQLATQPQSYFPGSTVVPFSSQSQMGMNRMERMALDPNSIGNQAVGQFGDTISGQYLPGGERFSAITAPTMDAINAQFSGGGRYGSAYHQQGLAKGMMEAIQPYWDSERGRMMSASAAAPGAQMAALNPLMQVGGALEGKSGEYLQDAMNRWDFAQNEPWNRLTRYASIINPGAGLGGTQTTTMPGGSKLAGGLGGALGGYSMASMIPALGPYGVPLAVAGGLLGAFG